MRLRHFRNVFFLLLLAAVLPVSACAQQDAASAAEALQGGRYEDAIRIATALVQQNPQDLAVRRTLVTALLETGSYEEAVTEAGTLLPNLRGAALEATGKLQEAEAAYQQAIDARGPDRWTAEFNLARLFYNRGQRAEALDRFGEFITFYNQTDALTAEDLTAIGNAVWYIGNTEPPLFQDAVKAFDEATQTNPSFIEAHIRIGELFVEKYNSTDAYKALDAALGINPNHPRVLLAVANAKQFDGDRAAALENVTRALEVNPNLVAARVLLARIKLDEENARSAEEELEKALEVNPQSIEALSIMAAIHFLRGDTREYNQVIAQVRQLDPTNASLLWTVAEIAAQQRRYGDAAEVAAQATALDPQFWPAFGALGLNLFRLGRIDEARAALETAFAGDPHNVWTYNNLNLLDTFDQYDMRTAAGLEFMLHRNEADVLMPYLEQAAVEALTDLRSRYGERPEGTVRVEMYPESADFSVRTIGLPGMGALGVSFGDLVALDSPSARQAGRYSWATTLWHELGHTVALKVSNNRVPRWFTEGLSTLEERRAKPGWTIPTKPDFLMMYYEGELPPPSRLTEGFTRPKSPQHLGGAYDLASLVVQWIDETHGFETIVRILRGYRDGRSDEQIITSVLRTTPEAFDRDFAAWLEARAPQEKARDYIRFFTAGQRQLEEGDKTAAKRSLEAAGALFTTSGGGSAFTLLAQIHVSEGNQQAAIDALRKVALADETAYEPDLELARLLEATGDKRGAADALERAVWIHPFAPEPHIKLATLYTELGDHAKAVRERRVIVGLRPTDRADAYYQLALALNRTGDRVGARREVLRALEAAPSFGLAQELLLQLHEGQ